jgi:predicted aspartyl protease
MTYTDSSQQDGHNLTQQLDQDSTNGICTINRVNHSMTVDGLIGSTPISFLIDTGASCTLLSEEKFRAISEGNNHILQKLSGRTLRQADGTPLSTAGKLNVEIQIGPVVVHQEVIIAKISDEGIIGYMISCRVMIARLMLGNASST